MLQVLVSPNKAAAPDSFALRITKNGQPVRGASVTLTFNHTEMQMPQQEYQLKETQPGVYSRAAPALVMVGKWALSFQITPKTRPAVHRPDPRPGQRMTQPRTTTHTRSLTAARRGRRDRARRHSRSSWPFCSSEARSRELPQPRTRRGTGQRQPRQRRRRDRHDHEPVPTGYDDQCAALPEEADMRADRRNTTDPCRKQVPNVTSRLGAVALALISATALAACGSSSGGALSEPTIGPARTYSLAGFEPGAPVQAGRRTMLSFTIQQPSGKPLTDYRKCCEPHAGVDLIIVRSDDSHVQYDDSDIAANGKITQPVVFPAPGRYRIVVSAFLPVANPQTQNNFQLFTTVTVTRHLQAPADPAVQRHPTCQRVPLPGPGHPAPARHPGELPHDQCPRPARASGDLHDLARSARARDLLPRRHARLLPHPRLQPRRDLLQLRARRHEGHRQLHRPGAPQSRGAAT